MSPADALLEIYRDVGESLAALGYRCAACGQCCDFDANDYELYASGLEAELVLGKTGRRPELVGGRCCFQDACGRCAIHEWRPLGCRTFFCQSASRGATASRAAAADGSGFQALHEDALARIRMMAEQSGEQWEYGPFFRNP